MKAGLMILLSLWGIYTAEVGVREQSGKNGGERVDAYRGADQESPFRMES